MKLRELLSVIALFAGLNLGQSKGALIGFFPFNDSTSPLKDESSSPGSPGPLVNTGDPANDPEFSSTAGIGNTGAYIFNGTQRLLTQFEISPATYPTLTMGAWVKASSLSSGLRKVIGADNGGWDRALGLDNRPAGVLGFATFTGGGVLNSEHVPPGTNEWAFIAATYDQVSGQIVLYVDPDVSSGGPLITRSTSGFFADGPVNAAIGGVSPDNTGEGWLGTIDNVFFYDEVLSAAQLAVIRDRGAAAILGLPGGDDPHLGLTSAPDLNAAFPKLPETRTFAFGLTNTGGANILHIQGITVRGEDAGHFTVESFPSTLSPQSGGTLNLKFDNKGQIGNFSAELVIISDDASATNFVIELTPRVSSPALLGFYSFDDEANPLKDDSGANRTLTAPVMPFHDPAGGIEGGGVLFDGSQRLAAPININPGPVPNLTMGAWVRTDVTEGLHKIIGQDNGGWDRTLGLDNRGSDGSTHYTAFTGHDVYPVTEPLAVPESNSAWTFVAAVYEQSRNLVTTYVDLDVASTNEPPLTGSASTTLGSGEATVGIGGIAPIGTGEPWIGSIDNVFFIAGALDAEQISELRNRGKSYLQNLTPDPILSVQSELPFGTLATSAAITANIRITNSGSTQPLRISRAAVTGPDANLYTVGALPAEIAPGATATIPVTLNPGAETAGVDASLSIYSNNSGNRITQVNLAAFVPFSSARAALAAFYPFDDPENPGADASGNGADATPVVDFEPFHMESGGFKGTGAYLFEAAQRLSAPVNINPSVNPKLTMGAWVQVSTLDPEFMKIMGHDDGGWDRAIGIDLRGTAGLTTHHYTAFAGRDAYPLTDPPATPVSTEDWTFIAAVYDQLAATVTTFIDLDASSTNDALMVSAPLTTTLGEGNPALGIGALSPTAGEFWRGMIDNVFVYRTALTTEQLTAIRNGGPSAILAEATPDLRIINIQRGADLRLTWNSSEGQTYSIQYTPSITGTWQDIATVTSSEATTTYTDSDASRLSGKTGFYQIVQQ
jgi:hypothetical protein